MTHSVCDWTHTLSEAQADPPTAEPSRVAVDEKQIKVDGERKWLYAAIDTDSKHTLGGRRVQPPLDRPRDGSDTTTTTTDRIKRSMNEHRSRRLSTRHCPKSKSLPEPAFDLTTSSCCSS